MLALAGGVLCACAQSQARSRSHPNRISVAVLAQEAIRAYGLMAKDDYLGAREILERIAVTDASDPVAMNALGVCAMKTGDTPLARWAFERAIDAAPDASEPHNNLGLLYEESGRFAEAIRHYEAAMQRSDDITILGNLTRTQLRMRMNSPAICKQLERIQAEHPEQSWRDWARYEQVKKARSE